MTAFPDPAGPFETFTSAESMPAHMTRPNVKQEFWGYEVAPAEEVFDLSVLMRGVALMGFLGALVAAIAIWMVPAMSFSGDPLATKALISLVALVFALSVSRVALRSTRIRLQVDTANGELREVVAGVFRGDTVIASYGIDTVQGVKIVTRQDDTSLGQIQIAVAGVGRIPAGDGSILMLERLKARLQKDLGCHDASTRREAVWTGPIAA